jgi:biopolymer transport protein TolR
VLAHYFEFEVCVMAMGAGTSSGGLAEINVTPLIDVLLVLLIIFMVIGPVLPHGLDSAIPQAPKQARATEPQAPVTVRVVAGPAYRIDGGGSGVQEVSFAELRPALARIFAGRAEGDGRTLFLEGERSLSFADVAAVAGEGKAAGAGQIALMGGGK